MTLLLVLLGFVLNAADRERPTDYPTHTQLDSNSMGAEFMGRSVLSAEGSALLREYVAIEVGLLIAKGQRPVVATSHFLLRINGKKQMLMSQTPGMVAASVKFEDWEQRPALIGSAGVGDTAVILGRPRQTERFPGDRRPTQDRLPAPPKAPAPEERSGIEAPVKLAPGDVVLQQALPEGESNGFVRGLLYFPFQGKIASIQKIELLYEGPLGKTVLVLKR